MLHVKKSDDSPSFDTSIMPIANKFSDSDVQSQASNDGLQDEPTPRPVEGQGDELLTAKSDKHNECKSAPAKILKNLKKINKGKFLITFANNFSKIFFQNSFFYRK